MMRLALALALAPVGAALAASSDNVFDVTEYGAVGDGATDNTVAFRNATTAAAVAATADTPTVLFVPHGNFMTGAFNLSSHVTLELSGADSSIVGLATTSEIAFPVVPPLPSYGKARDGQPARYQALIMATDATNVAINGNGGLIDGGKCGLGVHLTGLVDSIEMPALLVLPTLSRGSSVRFFLVLIVSTAGPA